MSENGNNDDILLKLVAAAHTSGNVARLRMDDGMMLFAYPDTTALIIGIGYGDGDSGRVRPEVVLRRRSENPARYACWLPAVFADGSWFVLRRLALAEARSPALVRKVDLDSARELLLS